MQEIKPIIQIHNDLFDVLEKLSAIEGLDRTFYYPIEEHILLAMDLCKSAGKHEDEKQ